MSTVQRLGTSVQALAALGAGLRLQQHGDAADPRVAALLSKVVRAVDPEPLGALEADRAAAALALVRMMFGQALDLLENPSRAPGWSFRDAIILQSQGQLSRIVVRGIEAIAAERPELGGALRQRGTLLDVGTGVGWLAIEAARAWPALRVVGIDPWEPALALARENRAACEVAERVEFRTQRVEDVDDVGSFTLAWLPGPFIAAQAAGQALQHIHAALSPGGWLIFGCYPRSAGPLEQALADLRDARNGGHPWTTGEIEQRLRTHDFEDVQTFSPPSPVHYVIARRPAD
jgi:precorrin-6B methylase 2